ncbi:MAG TPA: NPCBM/NEW2 domain-containing protein [Streptosporangiaceae bacterium]
MSPATSAAPPATTGTNLFTQSPVQANDATVTNGAVQIGNTAYPDSARFTCGTGIYSPTSLVYDVAGFAFLNATLGVPSNATNAAGNTMNITFFKDGSTEQLGKTITVSLDSPVALHVNLDGASQLAIDCAATPSASDAAAPMDIAFGNAVLASS